MFTLRVSKASVNGKLQKTINKSLPKRAHMLAATVNLNHITALPTSFCALLCTSWPLLNALERDITLSPLVAKERGGGDIIEALKSGPCRLPESAAVA